MGISALPISGPRSFQWLPSGSKPSSGFDEAPPEILRARFSLLGERPDDGRIELGFVDGRRTVDRDTEIAVELLCEHVHAAIERIAAQHEAEETGSRTLLRLRR